MILRKINPNLNEAEYLANLEVNNQDFINALIIANGILPIEAPVEIHPYLNEFQLQYFDKYIVGTYPPISYVSDLINLNPLLQPNNIGLIHRPIIPFYHGNNPNGNMWYFLLGEFNFNQILQIDRIEAKLYIVNFLNSKKINYSDIIKSTKRRLINQHYNAEDKNLYNLVINKDLIKQILSNPNSNSILFNTGSPFSNSGIKIRQNNVQNGNPGLININSNVTAFDLFLKSCQELGFVMEIKIKGINDNIILPWTILNNLNRILIQNHLKNKIIFFVKIKVPINNHLMNNQIEINKELTIITPFSPAAVNRGRLQLNLIVQNWMQNNENQTPSNLLCEIYQAFARFNNEDYNFLISLNV